MHRLSNCRLQTKLVTKSNHLRCILLCLFLAPYLYAMNHRYACMVISVLIG